MIIINKVCGQLCNQLFLFAHLLAYGAATGRRVWFPGFRRNEGLFEYFVEDRKSWSKIIYLPFSASWSNELAESGLRRFLHADGKLLRLFETVMHRKFHVSLDCLTELMFPEMEGGGQPTSPLCLFEGWLFRVPIAFADFAPQLRNIFRFHDADIRRSKAYLKSLPQRTLIGVHIRQSDYAQCAPQWHYHPTQYLGWMTELHHEMGPDVGFVVVSDANLPDFNESWISSHRGNAIQDLCVLSHCDRIMGPPSTFNRWAAFMGDKPHLCLWNEKQRCRNDDFAPFKMLSDTKSLLAHEIEALKWCGVV